ncbi:hypothetical protein [Enterococcus rivorum]|uniref:DUF3784 domain-containing protein n=1 Tax=Enterococcus rivorum TaxID=762845 RepID=A0A1E5KU24_9ENTE|nr:hypothetical protein [Enterococcus rivorum]MBP2098427.1 hypothetical protein [Enterococcus rivorum]OEH81363.1 hypothetical protein BCR26_16765 [Enterococcus rivorum]
MTENYIKIIFSLTPSLLLLLGGFLFTRYKNKLWNNPLLIILKNDRETVNELTGKIWIIEGMVLLIIIVIFRLYRTTWLIISLYFFSVILSYAIVYYLIKKKKD